MGPPGPHGAPMGPGPLGPGPLRPRAPGPGSLRPRAPEAQGPWARVLEAHRPRGPPMGDPPWDPWGDPPGIPGTPLGPQGRKNRFFQNQKKSNKNFKSTFSIDFDAGYTMGPLPEL